ncbi:MAG TPA: cytochrome P450, partial [Nitrococcus sp.]|nr:cytochrome P450 [Nitrococcus sp.]
DPPEHTRLRAIMARALSAQRIKRLRARIAGIADQLADAMAQRREVDLIESFAMPFPLRVICEALGVPAAAEPLVQSWSARLEAADLEAPEQVPRIAQEMHDYLLALAQAKRLAPDDSLLGALVAAHGRGALSESELTATAFLLLLAGHETTANLIGNGVLALLRHGTAWSALCGPPDLAAALVEELLRLESPLEVATARFATLQIELEGVCIQPGDRVFIGLAAANRDPARFDRPHRLQADRCPMASHLAFGHGIHYCLGAALARLEGEVAFSVLARRFPDLELAAEVGDLLWKPGLIMRGLERLPVYCGRRLE